MIEALTKRWQTEGNQITPVLIPIGNEKSRDIFNRDGFKRIRVADLDRPFKG